jgi:hypothetical protein
MITKNKSGMITKNKSGVEVDGRTKNNPLRDWRKNICLKPIGTTEEDLVMRVSYQPYFNGRMIDYLETL